METIIEKEDIITLKHLLSLKKINSDEVHIMQTFINKYIDNKCNICATCPAQIRFAHSRIEKWFERYKDTIEQIEMNEIKLCDTCGILLEDKRRKTCKACK